MLMSCLQVYNVFAWMIILFVNFVLKTCTCNEYKFATIIRHIFLCVLKLERKVIFKMGKLNLGSEPAGDVSHKPAVRRVTLATLKTAATNFAAW